MAVTYYDKPPRKAVMSNNWAAMIAGLSIVPKKSGRFVGGSSSVGDSLS